MIGNSPLPGARCALIAPLLLALPTGCTQSLETGYKPHALNASPAQRRAYYASPFSPEAVEGQKEAPDTTNFHKPNSL